ncbi:MAG: hypothetical protein HFI93_10690 [Lachnospiraceae bacterium]|nr:hypothetical protein [Lachnospiraceae bacterium]
MFKTVLDLASIDYNGIMENAMDALKNHPDAAKTKGIKLPGKLQMLLFKKLPDDKKTQAIAQLLNSPEGQTQTCQALEQMLSGLFQVRVVRIEARTEEPDLVLRLIADMEDMNSELALGRLFPTLAMVPDYPDILGSAYRPGMNAQDALSAALNLPKPERELAVLKLIKHAKPALLGSLEMSARSQGLEFHIADLKFLVPR